MRFTTKNQSDLGVKSNTVFVYSRKRLVGYVDNSKLSSFLSGEYSLLEPVCGWRNTFSQSLKIELGLA